MHETSETGGPQDGGSPLRGDTSLHPIEDVRHYPRPPRLERVAYPITITFGGQRIVETTGASRVLETFHPPTYYIPPQDVAPGALQPVRGSSICEWKGPARYFDVLAGDRRAARSAWCYPDPFKPFAAPADHVAFYCHPMDACTVDGLRAEPQPGNFYGGWVTPWITGPIKGAAGTMHW